MKIAICDLDDCLSDSRTPIMESLNASTGKNIHWNEWHTYDLATTYGIKPKEMFKSLLESNFIETTIADPDAVELIRKLKAAGYYIIIITARGWHENAFTITEKWLRDNNIPFDELHVTTFNEPKSIKVLHFKNIDIAIDDAYHNILDYESTGKVKHSILMHQPWNKNIKHDKRIYKMTDAMDYIS